MLLNIEFMIGCLQILKKNNVLKINQKIILKLINGTFVQKYFYIKILMYYS
jgi:hypothetical protein